MDCQIYLSLTALPKGLKWTKDVKFWVSREGDHYVDKIIPDPTYYSKITFKLNEKSTANFNGQDVEVNVRCLFQRK